MLDQYIVDAFENGRFTGNPAAVVPLSAWPSEGLMQAIAGQNNLSETAFFVPSSGENEPPAGEYELRWFTPTHEVPLCGHATLATAHVIWAELESEVERLTFSTRSGPVGVTKSAGESTYALDFPESPLSDHVAGPEVLSALGIDGEVHEAFGASFVVCESADEVRRCKPDFAKLANIGAGFAIVTARADLALEAEGFDVVVRVFAPGVGIDEDPATGSAHCAVAPYWCDALGQTTIRSFQASARGGYMECTRLGDGRVSIAGSCRTFSAGKLRLNTD